MKKLMLIVCLTLGFTTYAQENEGSYLFSPSYEFNTWDGEEWIREEPIESPTHITVKTEHDVLKIQIVSENVPVYNYTVLTKREISDNEYDSSHR